MFETILLYRMRPTAPPQLHAELKADGVSGGRHRIARLMRDNGMKALQKRRYKKTTHSDHVGLVAPNVLDQDFSADTPNQKWGADISDFWTAEDWLYLAILVELELPWKDARE